MLASTAHANAVVVLGAGSRRPAVLYRDHLNGRAAQLTATLSKALAVADLLANPKLVAAEELAAVPGLDLADVDVDLDLHVDLDLTGPDLDIVVPVGSTEPAEGPFRPLTDTERSVLAEVFGDSLDPEYILMTPYLGFGNRPFTLTLDAPLLGSLVFEALGGTPVYVSFINMGAVVFEGGAQQGNSTFVHEAAHVWQAEHHHNHTAYERNSVLSQAGAWLAGGSAYHYKRDRPFRRYGAEQLASQVDNTLRATPHPSDLAIRDEMRAVPSHDWYGPLVIGMLGVQWEIPGEPGVVS
jgi:hypothetical protein